MINPDDVTFSFMCRAVQKSAEVYKANGHLVNPKLTKKKTDQDKTGRTIAQNTKIPG